MSVLAHWIYYPSAAMTGNIGLLPHYKAIYLSPHLDDVVFSCGAQIFMSTSAGEAVLIATVTAGDPPAVSSSPLVQNIHDRWQLAENAVAGRRAEDVLACQIVGADYLHWDFLDCIYRTDPATGEPLYATGAALFGDVHGADRHTFAQLTQQMAMLPTHEQLFLPLTAGNHVDHQLTRSAAEHCFGFRNNHFYYEDYPYVREAAPLAAALQSPPADGETRWIPRLFPLSEASLEAKVAAVLAYDSQLSTFFSGPLDVEAQIKGYARQVWESSLAAGHAPAVRSGQTGWHTASDQYAIGGTAAAERVWFLELPAPYNYSQ
jgi:LmbE family N-acetylglucosaminyl deacetylase